MAWVISSLPKKHFTTASFDYRFGQAWVECIPEAKLRKSTVPEFDACSGGWQVCHHSRSSCIVSNLLVQMCSRPAPKLAADMMPDSLELVLSGGSLSTRPEFGYLDRLSTYWSGKFTSGMIVLTIQWNSNMCCWYVKRDVIASSRETDGSL